MGILIIAGIVLIIALVFGPQYWVKHIIKKHAEPRPDLSGTGGELAEHLIEHYQLNGVGVEVTDQGDHYDPESRTVRLSADNYKGYSISAVAIAAHEVGHAIQHARGERLLGLRQSLAKLLIWTDRFASIFFFIGPLLALVTRSPALFLLMSAFGIGLMAMRVVVQVVTLPVEFDASFKKALPILEQGGYLHTEDLPAARSVLKAAAMTYVAAALMSLLNILRFMRFGR